MTPRRPAVLVTAAGSPGMIDVLRSLEDIDRYRLVAADVSRHAVGFMHAAQSYVVPFAADPAFEAAITRVLERERPAFVVSTVDEEIPVFHRLAATRFAEMLVVTPRPAFCDLMLDKWHATEALRAEGIPVPETWLAGCATQAVFPAIIKPRVGRGSRGFAMLDDAAGLAAYLASAPGDADDYIVQRRLPGQEYTVSVVVALGGPLLAVVPKEVVAKRGVTGIGVTREVPAIHDTCAAIQARLHADGPFNVQLMLSADGIPYVFEVNPRYSTTTALTIAAGLNEVDAVIRHALGEHPGPLTFRSGLAMVRYTAAVYMDEAGWPAADRA